ncbi:hypothetical protein FRC11_007350 [Ceratobasidium sp. 423]|nr:hypothetical protein FRC11_007350 [Ceratobasidium sp. 423]
MPNLEYWAIKYQGPDGPVKATTLGKSPLSILTPSTSQLQELCQPVTFLTTSPIARVVERARAENRSTLRESSSHSGLEHREFNQNPRTKGPRPCLQLDPETNRPRIRRRGKPLVKESQGLPPICNPSFAPISVALDEDDGELRMVTEDDRRALMESNVVLNEALHAVTYEFQKGQCKLVCELVSQVVAAKKKTNRFIRNMKKGSQERAQKLSDLALDIRAKCVPINNLLKSLQRDHTR